MKKENEVILKVENLSKQYRLGLVGKETIKEDIKRWWYQIQGKEDPFLKVGEINDRSTYGLSEYVWALKNINIEVKKGEVLGIIGANGAGKSTLLKILSKVTGPTLGNVKFNGRIASLLEVGTGFHGELTGRENIFLNGAILGMTKDEINRKLDKIIEFSSCERYIDTPVKRYSSGMNVRLAFAVAAFLEPDILIIDEVLAVGDAQFQKKAIGKMQDISGGKNGRTVLFVSHNMVTIRKLCERVIILQNGEILAEGEPEEMINLYLNKVVNFKIMNPSIRNNMDNSIGPKIIKCSLLNNKNEYINSFIGGDEMHFKLKIKPDSNITEGYCLVWFIKNYSDEVVAACSSGRMDNIFFNGFTSNIEFKIDTIGLIPGNYLIRFVLHIPGEDNFDDWDQSIFFDINMHDIGQTGYNYSSNWNPMSYLKTTWNG